MPFVKVVKTRAYFKRYQVKYRRRREGKTDYQARRRLVNQDKNKYNSHKFRFVVRRTNKKIICQVIYATVQGDRVMSAADSSELTRYGIPIGHTNYSAAYCTGLLCARRLLTHLKMDTAFVGIEKADGTQRNLEEAVDGIRPFKALLDVGLVRTTTGCRVFGALKGACDGGLNIPHSNKRFPGFKSEGKGEGSYDAELHRSRIFGLHVANYMQQLQEDDNDAFNARFSQFIKHGIQADGIEAMYAKAHQSIRADPKRIQKDKKKFSSYRDGNYMVAGNKRYLRPLKLTIAQRKQRITRKIELMASRMEE